jgi:DNA-directed RNA polymerase subunit RPC12/RpoP
MELFKALDINPQSRSLNYNDVYLMKIAGWVNRLNEIRERMKCEECTKPLIPNNKYAFRLAAYNSTVAYCPDGHGDQIYFNHCWNCRNIIDSRESSIQHEGYYICIYCGSGPKPQYQKISFNQGDKCPKCGTPKMKDSYNNELIKECRNCNHRIHLKGKLNIRRVEERFAALQIEDFELPFYLP